MGSLNCTVFFSTLQSFFLPFRAVENVPESAPSAMREPCSLDSVDAHFFFPAGGSPLANGRRVSVVEFLSSTAVGRQRNQKHREKQNKMPWIPSPTTTEVA